MSIIHIPFYPSDWLAGTLGLSDTEKGVYITLICRMYEMAGPIERDDNRLFRICGSKSKASFVKALEYLIEEGKIIVTSDGLFNEKVGKVIEQTTEKSTKAKAAAQSRWDRKSNKNKEGCYANASPKHMHQPCQLEPELYKGDTNVSLARSGPDRFQEFWDQYPHRNGAKKGRSKSEASYLRHFKAGTDESAIIGGAIRYAGDRQVLEGYAKDPTTWLNGKGWEDEIETSLKPIEGNGHGQRNSNGVDRLQRIVGTAATGTSGKDWG